LPLQLHAFDFGQYHRPLHGDDDTTESYVTVH